jgi:hypothetical protein
MLGAVRKVGRLPRKKKEKLISSKTEHESQICIVSFLIVLFYLAVQRGRTPWTADRPDTQDNTTQRNADTHPTFSTFERPKTVLASDRSAIETGPRFVLFDQNTETRNKQGIRKI